MQGGKIQFESLLLEKKKGVAKIVLNRPQVLNALSTKLLLELKEALQQLEKDDEVQVVVITGAGKAFCAGRDLKELSSLTGEELGKAASPGLEVCQTIGELQKPVIAAVNGFCYTGGLELVIHCDMIIASESAVFADTHTRYGLLHDWEGSQLLIRLVGLMKAKEIIFTSEPITAKEAERIGLVNRVVPAEKLEEAVDELAERIIRNSQASIKVLKKTMNRGMKLDLGAALELEASEHSR